MNANSSERIPPPAAHAGPVTHTASKEFYMSITDEVKNSRFKEFQYKTGLPVKNGAVPGYRYDFTMEEIMAREQMMK